MPSQTKVDQWYLVMSVSYVSEHLINKNLYYAWVKKNLNDKAVFYTFFGGYVKKINQKYTLITDLQELANTEY